MKNKGLTLPGIILLLVGSLLLTVGCSKGDEQEWPDGSGNIPDQLGSDTGIDSDTLLTDYFEDYMDIIEQTEYDMPTSKWFTHDDEGIFLYSMPFGTMESGAPYEIILNPVQQEAKVGRKIRIQLTKRDNRFEKLEDIIDESVYLERIEEDEEIFMGELPEEENVIYIVSMEVLNEQEEVEDTMVRVIYVPKQEINASISMDKETYTRSDREAKVDIENHGPTFLMTGRSYLIEKKVKQTWKEVPLDLAFDDVGILINPTDVYVETIDISKLQAGDYRIVKSLHADDLDLSKEIAKEFTVK